MMNFPHRVLGVRARMSQAELDAEGQTLSPAVPALVISNLDNVRYLTGFSGSNGLVVLTATDAIFFTDGRYQLQAEREVPGFHRVILPQGTALAAAAGKWLVENGLRGAGFEGGHLTYNGFKTLEAAVEGKAVLTGRSGVVESVREVKEPEEIIKIKAAVALADACFDHLCAFIRPGRTEKEIAWEIEVFCRTHGATRLGFDCIIGSGENGAFIHGRAGERVLGSSGGPEFVLCDYGCELDGYHSDITRTFVIGGQPTARMKEIYQTVQRAQQAGLDAIKPGVSGRDVDATVRGIIRDAGFGEMGHGTGHGLGRLVHDVPLPTFSPLATVILRPGIVATVEPGIYIENLGGVRIEDDIVVTETGIEVLNRATKELLVLG
jgi:Xaa-Pro aminopeptidase